LRRSAEVTAGSQLGNGAEVLDQPKPPEGAGRSAQVRDRKTVDSLQRLTDRRDARIARVGRIGAAAAYPEIAAVLGGCC
jgi:hypothetical protein